MDDEDHCCLAVVAAQVSGLVLTDLDAHVHDHAQDARVHEGGLALRGGDQHWHQVLD